MMSLRIITVILCATLLSNVILARPRAEQSSRFPKFSDNSVGEFVLWSCTATAQLRKTNVNNNNNNNNTIKIEPATTDIPATKSPVYATLSPLLRKDDDRTNNIQIIKVNTISHKRNRRPNSALRKKIQNNEKTDQEIQDKNVINPIGDSPLKTIKVNAFGKDTPVLFKEKPLLPQIQNVPVKVADSPQHSSQITVIKP